ncbi:MAG TPA: ABC transporter permease [Anaerolineae bacterium]|nr:ABC transporter permease [Anaerolineae bacterium]HQH39462.1 ABC transporter permease [Anaerolineae bacterium]
MLQRTWAVLQKEFIQTLRDRSTLILMLSMPLLQLFMLGYAVDMNVEHIPTIVADQSLDAPSLAYVEAMVNTQYFDVVEYAADEAAVVAAIDSGRVQAGIVIPPDFAARVERGEAQVLFLIDGSDLFTVQSGYTRAAAIAQSYASEVLLKKIERSGLPLSAKLPLDTRVRVLYNPDMQQLWFTIPSMIGLLMQTTSVAMTAAAVVREREAGTIEQLLVTPIRPLELLLGKIMPNVCIAIINVLTIVGAGNFLFHVPFRGNFWLFMGLAMIYVFSGLGLGLLISTVANNLKQSQQLVMMIMLLGVVLGGFIFPRNTMPPVLQVLGLLFPMTYFTPISRGIITKGVGLDAFWDSALAMTVYAAILMAAAVKAFRQKLE